MPLTLHTTGGELRALLPVEAGGERREVHFAEAIRDDAASREVQADLDTPRMKAACPIDGLARGEVVPLKAEPQFAIAPVQLPPAAITDRRPRGVLAERKRAFRPAGL